MNGVVISDTAAHMSFCLWSTPCLSRSQFFNTLLVIVWPLASPVSTALAQ